MRKIYLIPGIILILILAVVISVKYNYKNAPDYNYISAKLDIAKGNIRIINIGFRTPSSKDAEIDSVAKKFGFKNIYIGNDTTKNRIGGINNYNEMTEAYLMVRNGNNWKMLYKRVVDSLIDAGAQPFRK